MGNLGALGARHGHWVVVGMIGACAIVAACGSGSTDSTAQPSVAASSGSTGTVTPDAEPAEVEPETESSSGTSGASSTSGAVPPDAGRSESSTDANLRVAFIADTAAEPDFKKVLQLIKSEKAQLVVIQGDLTYSGENAADWFPAIDNEINKDQPGSTATVTIPYFASKGNHDTDWNNLAAGFKTRFAKWGIAPDDSEPVKKNYTIVYKGLKVVMVDQAETSPTRADYIKSQLENDTHTWKICSWHKNMRATNVGPKNDEMPWSVYETCRTYGAIVAQGHSHTYSRSKTITNDQSQTVDPTCNDPFKLCVGPGKHFFFDSSVGGHDLRSLDSTWKNKPYWSATYSSSFGALFIDFNVDGAPNKARGYFKNIAGTVIDPPASSGKTTFEITSSN